MPAMSFPESTRRVLAALNNQTIRPDEVVIVDSSKENELDTVINEFRDDLVIKQIKVNKAYPGEARNIGVNSSANDLIAFVDSKTAPIDDWLEQYCGFLERGYDLVFGSTQYQAFSSMQRIILSTIYGSKPVITTPGTILNKSKFFIIGSFAEGVRSSEDLEWRQRSLLKNLKIYQPQEAFLFYSDISNSIFSEIKKQFTYQIYTSFLGVQLTVKTLIFSLVLLLITLLIPQWNALVGWEDSLLYIPDITKSYFYLLSIFSVILLLHSILVKRITILFKIFTGMTFIVSSYLIFQWNFVMANWVEDSVFYIPHITKIYLSLIIFIALIFRGIYKPLKLGASKKYIFPFRWIAIGLVGLILDLAKVPGYFLGAIIALKIRFIG